MQLLPKPLLNGSNYKRHLSSWNEEAAELAKQYSLRAKREEQEQDSQHKKEWSLARIRARKAAKDLGYDEEESPF